MNSKSNSNINSEQLIALPPELIQLIVLKLPFVNLPTYRLVCKAWNKIVLSRKFDLAISISNLFFVHNSLYDRILHCVDFDPKHLGGMNSVAKFRFHSDFALSSTYISINNSCNGLLFFSISHYRGGVCILNPMTNEYFKLSITDHNKWYHYGFGFSPKTKQYKLARFSFDKQDTLVEIFGFGTNREWKFVGFVPPFIVRENHGVYFNGGLYWLGCHWDGVHRPTHTDAIYRLDVEEEKFHEIPFPQSGHCHCFMGVCNGALYLTVCVVNLEYRVWKMEGDLSWTRAFDVFVPMEYLSHRSFDHLQLIRVCGDGKILCLLAGCCLILFDPETGRVELLDGQDFKIRKVHWIDSFNFGPLSKILAGDS